jgi:hypothetical protein
MNFWLRNLQNPAWLAVGGAVVLLLVGCNNIFMPKHRVLVDAICAPGFVANLSGTSYRLVAKKSVVSNVAAQISVIKACVDAALTGKGMFEAPPSVAPEIFIEVGFGVDTTPRVDASARESFLQLSARSNPAKALDRGTGPELWDVRVAVLGVTGRMETAMPLLAAVASDYIGTDTKLETRIEIPQNAPAIGAVRATAIKTLEGNAPAASGGRDAPKAAAAANAAVKPVTTK